MITHILQSLVATWNQMHYQPLLEADVAGWLFHLFQVTPDAIPTGEELHLDTRVLNAVGQRFDLVVGNPEIPNDQRPAINPSIVIEIKLFPNRGFTAQQHRVHFLHILEDDLPKLGALGNRIQHRVSLIVDGADYLNGQYQQIPRAQAIVDRRDEEVQGVLLFLLRFTDPNWSMVPIG